jgi:lipoic acid synthetase
MVGLGETEVEVLECMRDLRAAGADILTLGQYLRPSAWHLPVVEWVTPARFAAYREAGLALGFRYVASGPLVRSSYRAAELFLRGEIQARGGPMQSTRAAGPAGGVAQEPPPQPRAAGQRMSGDT